VGSGWTTCARSRYSWNLIPLLEDVLFKNSQRLCCSMASLLGAALLCGIPGLAQSPADACAALTKVQVNSAEFTAEYQAGNTSLPGHCLVRGKIDRRIGVDGVGFAIGFELRLPDDWQGRFFFQGGGGMDGVINRATGSVTGGPTALARGFAVVATDAGHQGKPPNPGSDPSFARDQQARIDNAYRSIERVTQVSDAIVAARYGSHWKRAYFEGCSNGGRQALMAAQRFPLLFDGVISGAPAFRVTKSAIGSAWETIAFLSIAPKDASGQPVLSKAFSDDELKLVANRILDKCDALDGVKDGLVFNTEACHFDPASLRCPAEGGCLGEEKIAVLKKVFSGPVTSRGDAIYSDWAYDPGIASPGWRMLKLGSSQTSVPNSTDISLMLSGLAGYFMFPPVPSIDLAHFDFDKAVQRVADTAALQDPTSTQLSTFTQRGSKLLIYHGVADPFFSSNDTASYYKALAEDNGGLDQTQSWARYFLVPGMNHCQGGPALDKFDSLSAIVDWVEKGVAPEKMNATGNSFPGVSRPLCPYPAHAQYNGSGPVNDAASFVCQK
jgi:hypothetical protein